MGDPLEACCPSAGRWHSQIRSDRALRRCLKQTAHSQRRGLRYEACRAVAAIPGVRCRQPSAHCRACSRIRKRHCWPGLWRSSSSPLPSPGVTWAHDPKSRFAEPKRSGGRSSSPTPETRWCIGSLAGADRRRSPRERVCPGRSTGRPGRETGRRWTSNRIEPGRRRREASYHGRILHFSYGNLPGVE
jgi:hypothetical protein